MADSDGDSGSALTLSSLLCDENSDFLQEKIEDLDQEEFREHSLGPADDEYIDYLFTRENGYQFGATGNSRGKMAVTESWMKCARLQSVSWILKSRAELRFRYRTAYLSIIYFDRFLSEYSIEGEKMWVVRLATVACLSLAAKMEEVSVPRLTAFGSEPEYDFESEVIKKMELLVLNVLQWEMGLITPFCFMHFFVQKFQSLLAAADAGGVHGGGMVAKMVDFIFGAINEATAMDYRPSVVAAAAALAALDRSLSRAALETRITSVSTGGFTVTEDLYSCYELMQKLEPDPNLHTPKPLVKSREPSPRDPPANSSASSVVSNKRKRLRF